ncbi:hydroxyacyl-thioester dehydratase type 2, mitochondrial-like [Glandiceps talaboti]
MLCSSVSSRITPKTVISKDLLGRLCTTAIQSEKYWFKVGDTAEVNKLVTAEDVRKFANLTGDNNPVHLDEKYAKTKQFKRCIVHGVFMNGLVSAVIGTKLPGPGALVVSQEVKFPAPLYVGELVKAKVEVKSVRKGIVHMSAICIAPEMDKLVMSGNVKLYIPKETSGTDN